MQAEGDDNLRERGVGCGVWGVRFRVEEDLGVAPNAQSQGGAGGRSEVGGVKRRPPGQRTREPSAARAVVAVARCRPALLLSVERRKCFARPAEG